jgi:two-component system NtrC family response regulator
LIVDDDLAVCSSLKLLLKRAGMKVSCINRPAEVLPALEGNPADLVLLDMNFAIETSGKKGLEVLQKIKTAFPDIPVVLMTGWATVQLAVEGMKLGASDFIAKPWDNQQMLASIRTILKLKAATAPEAGEDRSATTFNHIVGEATAFRKTIALAQRVAKTDASVLILGESGVGKELIAEAIHHASLRAEKPFVKVNLGGISSSLFESEMFGHKRGAFTDAVADRKGRFEMAHTGTIFLDEIGDLEMSSQVKLLRVLQEKTFEVLGSSDTRKVDVRVVSATNKDLEAMVAEGSFREDLYYRINLIKVHIPALRERPGDIPLLVNHFVSRLKKHYGRPELEVSKAALGWLKEQAFPGNIRQLQNLVERAVLVSPQDHLEVDDFRIHYEGKGRMNSGLPEPGTLSLEEMEIQMIRQALEHHSGNVSQAARDLGLTRSALYRRLEKFAIPYKKE